MSEKLRGRKVSEEERERRKHTGTGRVWCHRGTQTKWVTQSEYNKLLVEGWKPGRKDLLPRDNVKVNHKSRKPVSEETREKQSLSKRGKKRPISTVQRMKRWRWVKDRKGNQLRVEVTELQNYLEKGWVRGRYSNTIAGLRSVYWPKSGKKKYVKEEDLSSFLEKGWLKGHPSTNCKSKKDQKN